MNAASKALKKITIGDPMTHESLRLLPLIGAEEMESGGEYLTLKEAVEGGMARIREVSEGGSVPELLLESRADLPVLIVDGEELGNTPKANLALAPGVHVIRVERDGYEPYEIEIEVAGGEEVRMTDIVLKPRQP